MLLNAMNLIEFYIYESFLSSANAKVPMLWTHINIKCMWYSLIKPVTRQKRVIFINFMCNETTLIKRFGMDSLTRNSESETYTGA